MATPIVMPRQGNTVETCTIVQWHKSKGDTVAQGDILFTYETDKATFEGESPAAGTLLEIFFDADQDVPVLTNIGAIGQPGENSDSLKPNSGAQVQSPPTPAQAAPAQAPAAAAQPPLAAAQVESSSAQSGAVSPRARMSAQHKGVALAAISGSGPGGRVIERDVLAALASGKGATKSAAAASAITDSLPAAGTGIGGRIRLADIAAAQSATATVATGAAQPEYTETQMSKIRTIISDRMCASLTGTAQLTMHASADATRIMALRSRLKAHGEKLGLTNITINDLVAYALTRTLARFPQINATLTATTLRQYSRVHLAMAVDTERGLMVPVVRNADLLGLNDLALSLKKVAASCINASISPDNLSGGTFTMTNLGAFGVEQFTPIINTPQVAILGVGTIVSRPVESTNGSIALVPHIGLSLTIDHRAVDGAPGARFLQALCDAVAQIDLTLAL